MGLEQADKWLKCQQSLMGGRFTRTELRRCSGLRIGGLVHGILSLLCATISVFSAYATSLLHFQAGISCPPSSKF